MQIKSGFENLGTRIKPRNKKSARRDSNSTVSYLKIIIPDETLAVYNCLPIFR